MTASTPVSLRAAAAELGISRKKLLRCVRDGMPVKRKGERVFVDLAEARAWIAENEGGGQQLAPPLHPDDPRHREKAAKTRLESYKLLLSAGHLLRADEVERRLVDEWATTRVALQGVPRQFPFSDAAREDLQGAIEAALEEALAALKADDPNQWPERRPVPVTKSIDFDFESDDDANFAPMFRTDDPRHEFHVIKAARAEAEVEKLESDLVETDLVLEYARRANEGIRSRVRAIALFIDTTKNVAEQLEAEVFEALTDLSNAENALCTESE